MTYHVPTNTTLTLFQPITTQATCLWIPVGVVKDDGVSGVEVDPQPARARREHEEKLSRSQAVELGHHLLTLGGGGRAVEAAPVKVAITVHSGAQTYEPRILSHPHLKGTFEACGGDLQ